MGILRKFHIYIYLEVIFFLSHFIFLLFSIISKFLKLNDGRKSNHLLGFKLTLFLELFQPKISPINILWHLRNICHFKIANKLQWEDKKCFVIMGLYCWQIACLQIAMFKPIIYGCSANPIEKRDRHEMKWIPTYVFWANVMLKCEILSNL